jgi:hypothetical protein
MIDIYSIIMLIKSRLTPPKKEEITTIEAHP